MPTSFDLALALAIVKGEKPCSPQDAAALADRLDAELRRRDRFASCETLTVVDCFSYDDELREQLCAAARDASTMQPGAIESAVRATAGEHAGLRGLRTTDVPGRFVHMHLVGAADGGYRLPALSIVLLERALREVAWEQVADALGDCARS